MRFYPRTHRSRAAAYAMVVLLLVVMAGVTGWVLASQRGDERDQAIVQTERAEKSQAETEATTATLLGELDAECDTIGPGATVRQRRICDAADDAAQTITGAAGPAGPQGPTGAAGTDGRDGRDGSTGPRGPRGKTGPAGENGQDGQPGPAGPEGPQGDPGPAGAAGPPGADGSDGQTGPTGDAGPTCPDGSTLTPRTLLTSDGPVDAYVCTETAPAP